MACYNLIILLSLFLFTSTISLTTVGPNLASLSDHVIQLEEMVTDLKSQSQVQEQKYAAVLSNVLSKLTTTTDELTTLKEVHNYTLIELASIKKKLDLSQSNLSLTLHTVETDHSTLQKNHLMTLQSLSNLENDHNNTVVMLAAVNDELKSVQNDLRSSKNNLNVALHQLESAKSSSYKGDINSDLGKLKTDVSNVRGNLSVLHDYILDTKESSVYFQVVASLNPTNAHDQEHLRFDTVTMNTGDGYNKSTGMFEAPVTGIYLFWAHVKGYYMNTFFIHLYKGNQELVRGYASEKGPQGVATITYIMKVIKGENVFFTKTSQSGSELFGNLNSYYGGMLLHKY